MTAKPALCKDAQMSAEQDAIRHFINDLCRATDLTPSALAKLARVSHTTLTRFLNNEDWDYLPSTTTIGKLKRAAATAITTDEVEALWTLSQRRATTVSVRRAPG
jgi:Holliday junction resolvasome RuvABC DNA-binding subunit